MSHPCACGCSGCLTDQDEFKATLRDIAHQAAQIGYTYGALGRDYEYVFKNVNDLLATGGEQEGAGR